MAKANVTITPFEEMRKSLIEKGLIAEPNKSFPKVREDDMRGRYTRTPKVCQHISEGKKGKRIKSVPKSEEHKRKLSEALRGRPVPEEGKLQRSITLKGKVPWNKGIHLTEEDKLHKSLAQKGKAHSAEHTRAAMLAQSIKPNKAESILIELLNITCPHEYEYVGDGRLIINGMSPDFANCNGQKKVIELFGDYWHSFKKTGRNKEQEEQERKAGFASLGFSCLILWEHELVNKKVELEEVINKIRAFNRGKANKPREGKETLYRGSKEV